MWHFHIWCQAMEKSNQFLAQTFGKYTFFIGPMCTRWHWRWRWHLWPRMQSWVPAVPSWHHHPHYSLPPFQLLEYQMWWAGGCIWYSRKIWDWPPYQLNGRPVECGNQLNGGCPWDACFKNIARIANAVQCHSQMSEHNDCHELQFPIVRIVISVSNVTNL